MNTPKKSKELLQLSDKLGAAVTLPPNVLAFIEIRELKVIDLLPDMMVMVRSLHSEKVLSFQRKPITAFNSGLLVSFQNILNPLNPQTDLEPPHVRIMPLNWPSEVRFPAHTLVTQITIAVESDYLKRFLGNAQQQYAYLFNHENTFWIEEFMSPEIATLMDEMVNKATSVKLPDSFYRLKSLELLYLLFVNLSVRESAAYRQLSASEIDAVYRVRNAMSASLDQAPSVAALEALSGMSEGKLRRIFTQVFGRGMYAYFQYLRMKEAARLLRDERLSVSETGYRLGFANLSHFGRLFEEHTGMKPKKWRDIGLNKKVRI